MPGRQVLEDGSGFEGDVEIQPHRCDLGVDPHPSVLQLADAVVHLLPDTGGVPALHGVAEQDRPAGALGDRSGQVADVIGKVLEAVSAVGLEHAHPELGEHVAERDQLVVAGQPARDGPAPLAHVEEQPRGGEPDGAALDALPQHLAHGLDLRLGGDPVVRCRSHHVVAQSRVSDEGGHVDGQTAVEGIEELPEGLPPPVDALLKGSQRDLLDEVEEAGEGIAVLGAARGEGDAAVARHHRGDPVVHRRGPERIPAELGIEMGVGVDEPRRHHQSAGVDDLGGFDVIEAPDRQDVAVADGDIAPEAGHARSVDHDAALDQHVTLHGHRPPPHGCD